ncbi:DUF1445 domain protein [Talaromyces stipitatus ATCC 10500]|uniref:DUF1445 domain protein n=1 Tax=Talaromyces stipitatus (strain ATCC 10500 / CBS 375.48 / QM 6759 / NRRL 1006) TaxID=441959 RepID=B8MPE1_TALSN|nr:DUF1445 domain protein [Talaromyces stipitatus ATCC 10500]EED14380.1 DUF1445 domain protein [Talaromyces stipitatus ATCC 10500]
MHRSEIENLPTTPAHKARLLSRHNLVETTSGLAGDYIQANLIVLRAEYADDFRMLCARNPVPCPILGATPIGDPHRIMPTIPGVTLVDENDFDIRTDIPSYHTFRTVDCSKNGGKKKKVLIETKPTLLSDWTTEHIAFLIGCSFSFEQALTQQGLKICHQVQNKTVAMYRSSIPLLPAGIFHGSSFVVSMRLYRPEQLEEVRNVTRPYLATHGEPIAWGWEGARSIGVDDVGKVDYGDVQVVRDGEIPVFWGCGVTPQFAVEKALERNAISGTVMSHKPGQMLVTDWKITDFLEQTRKQLDLNG